jgi:hypothetical protein
VRWIPSEAQDSTKDFEMGEFRAFLFPSISVLHITLKCLDLFKVSETVDVPDGAFSTISSVVGENF